MACVYQAVLHGPAGFRKVVALKLLTPAKKRGGNTQDVLVAVQEARIGGLLHHPNLVDVYELGEEDSHVYIAMEWVDGETLGQMARAVATVPPRVIVEIGIGTCRGLASAHGLHEDGRHLGLVHRDMKPGNVLISWEGDIKVADFGIASTHMEHAASQFDQIILGTSA
jgi:serine/threonine-protein kinase